MCVDTERIARRVPPSDGRRTKPGDRCASVSPRRRRVGQRRRESLRPGATSANQQRPLARVDSAPARRQPFGAPRSMRTGRAKAGAKAPLDGPIETALERGCHFDERVALPRRRTSADVVSRSGINRGADGRPLRKARASHEDGERGKGNKSVAGSLSVPRHLESEFSDGPAREWPSRERAPPPLFNEIFPPAPRCACTQPIPFVLVSRPSPSPSARLSPARPPARSLSLRLSPSALRSR